MQETRYKGNYITVTEEIIHGHRYERVLLRPGIQVIPYREDGKILLMHESRTHETISRWKLVSGWVDKDGKTPLEHAIDELAEEVGYTATSWFHISKMDDKNFTISFQTDFFACTDLVKIPNPPNNPDEGCQVLDCGWFSFDEIFDLMADGRMLKDNTILVALCYMREQLKNKKV
jgi:8-oxo-dGTP pyrophosphatase MutT (NUDIX family)